MSNRRPTLREKFGGEVPLQWPEPFRQRRLRLATSFKGFLECTRNQRLRRLNRSRLADAQHDDLPVQVRTAAGMGV
jgi:hypothetical protein